MKKTIFQGVCTALVTPFKNDSIHWNMLDRLVERQLAEGVATIVVSGTTGESPTLTDEEKQELIYHIKDFVGNDCVLLAGTGTNATERVVKLSKDAQDAGADGLLIVSPYYNEGNIDGLYKHYKYIAGTVNLPIILYNVPSRTGMDMSVALYKLLSEISNIVGVKEASSDITKIARIKQTCCADFNIWSGNDDQIVPAISMGAMGVVSVLSNVYPKDTVRMTEAALTGDFERASALQAEFMPLIEALFCEVNPLPVKYALKCLGFDCGGCRLPLGDLSQASKLHIDALLQ